MTKSIYDNEIALINQANNQAEKDIKRYRKWIVELKKQQTKLRKKIIAAADRELKRRDNEQKNIK